MRKKAVGKQIQYNIDHSAGNREYVTVYLAPVAGFDPECLNISVVAEGWASVHNKDAKRAYPPNLERNQQHDEKKDHDLVIVKPWFS